jgi:hypothetical protein
MKAFPVAVLLLSNAFAVVGKSFENAVPVKYTTLLGPNVMAEPISSIDPARYVE